MTKVVARFRDVLIGRPTSWVFPRVLPSQNPPSSDDGPLTSLWKGEGRLRCDLASEGAEVLLDEPTCLNRGEGLVAGRLRIVKGELGRRGRMWWWWKERG